MKKKKKIFLHIGTRKTGSSLIQNFCKLNKEKLLEIGFFYPDNDNFDERKGKSAGHWNLHRVFSGMQSKYSLGDYLPDISPAENVILSNEMLTSEYSDILRIAEKIHEKIALDYDVTVIVYLRRQDLYINSLYNEGIVSGNRKAEWSIEEFLNGGHIPELDYYVLVQSWANVFGKENIVVRPFEKQQFLEGDIIKDFLHSIGTGWQEEFIVPEEESKNPSPDIMLVEAVRQLNRIPLQNRPFYKTFLEKAFDELVFHGSYAGKQGQSYLSPSERIDILDRYAQGNEKVAREFLGRYDGRLFYAPEPEPDESWNPVAINNTDLVARIFPLFLEQKALEIGEEIFSLKTSQTNTGKTLEGQSEAIKQQGETIKQQSEAIETIKQQSEAIKQQGETIKQQSEAIKQQGETIKQQSEAIKQQNKKHQRLENFLHSNALVTFKQSRLSYWKHFSRFLRAPRLNEAKVLHSSGLVDPYYYFKNYTHTIGAGMPAAEHYVRYGAPNGLNPSDSFNTRQYLAEHPDVAHQGINPLVHFVLYKKGKKS
jgi:hypothetical protein